jgi:hypothetical protein
MHRTIRSGAGIILGFGKEADDSAKQAAIDLYLKPFLSLISMESHEPFKTTLC